MRRFLKYLNLLWDQAWIRTAGIFGLIVGAVLATAYQDMGPLAILFIVFLLAVLVVGPYGVFIDLNEEINRLSEKLQSYEATEPVLVIGFEDEDGLLIESLSVELDPIPDQLDINSAIDAKRRELEVKEGSNNILSDNLEVILPRNPNYNEEVEEFLKNYRRRLELERMRPLYLTRVVKVFPVIENRGSVPARDIEIEFLMPSAYSPMSEEENLLHYFATSEPDLYFPEMPKEPSPFSRLDLGLTAPNMGLIPPYSIYDPSNEVYVPNPFEPEYAERNGRHFIRYRLDKLIQHAVENPLEEFILWVPNIELPSEWTIVVRITAAELTRPKERELKIRFNQSS